jgi:alpha/beta hydrolase family protein
LRTQGDIDSHRRQQRRPLPSLPPAEPSLLSCHPGIRLGTFTVGKLPVVILAAACAITAMPAHPQASAIATHRYHEVHGSRLYVETFGSGAPIVFMHGGLASFDTNFAKQRDYFASFRKVIGIDRRGHGHSPDTAEPFSYIQMAEDAAAVIEQLGLGPVDVVGHSDGGEASSLSRASRT